MESTESVQKGVWVVLIYSFCNLIPEAGGESFGIGRHFHSPPAAPPDRRVTHAASIATPSSALQRACHYLTVNMAANTEAVTGKIVDDF
jgi:hypothetical protein